MKKIIFWIAVSADGFVAAPDGELDWMAEIPNLEQLRYGYDRMLRGVDAVLLGGNAYRELVCTDYEWPYRGKRVWVVSRYPGVEKEGVEFITGDAVARIAAMRREPASGKDILLAGGGQLARTLFEADLVDEMHLFFFPVRLGGGIPLFAAGQEPDPKQWIVAGERNYRNGVICQSLRRARD